MNRELEALCGDVWWYGPGSGVCTTLSISLSTFRTSRCDGDFLRLWYDVPTYMISIGIEGKAATQGM